MYVNLLHILWWGGSKLKPLNLGVHKYSFYMFYFEASILLFILIFACVCMQINKDFIF